MASTFIKRVCDPSQLTDTERDEIRTAFGLAPEDLVTWKLPVDGVTAYTQEVLAGRKTPADMGGFLTPAELADAGTLLGLIGTGVWTTWEVRNVLMMGERGTYTIAEIETFFGIS